MRGCCDLNNPRQVASALILSRNPMTSVEHADLSGMHLVRSWLC